MNINYSFKNAEVNKSRLSYRTSGFVGMQPNNQVIVVSHRGIEFHGSVWHAFESPGARIDNLAIVIVPLT